MRIKCKDGDQGKGSASKNMASWGCFTTNKTCFLGSGMFTGVTFFVVGISEAINQSMW